ncbi:hypothetical protein [Pleomorphomonas carboxyditropha]|uniref:Uncharacterized protein n=1 Tax=Pleomorphomonas carboxyditropha TaxID=2023338 RepID=A0A2G9X0Y9_9HYPH|nr:hypothetical protein [Pleomorphomonas carboxyditropha]PIP00627.1 hypothetical protein CJ014_00545 [Pleomorphomonas carboxyditropha]
MPDVIRRRLDHGLSPLSRRAFIGKLAGAVTPALALPHAPLGPETVASSAAPSRFERLHCLLAEAQRLAAASFPEFDFCPFPSVPGKDPCGVFGFLIFSRASSSEPPVIEYDGPGLYEIRLRQWSADFHQIHRVEMVPRRHRFAGQFRLRFPDAKPRARWWYVPRDDFLVIKRI